MGAVPWSGPVVETGEVSGLPENTDRTVVTVKGMFSCCDIWMAAGGFAWNEVSVEYTLVGQLGSHRVPLLYLRGDQLCLDVESATAGQMSGIAMRVRGVPCQGFELIVRRTPAPITTAARFTAVGWGNEAGADNRDVVVQRSDANTAGVHCRTLSGVTAPVHVADGTHVIRAVRSFYTGPLPQQYLLMWDAASTSAPGAIGPEQSLPVIYNDAYGRDHWGDGWVVRSGLWVAASSTPTTYTVPLQPFDVTLVMKRGWGGR